MNEQWGREAPEDQASPRNPEEVEREEQPRLLAEFRSYSLEALAVLEG